MSSGERYHVKLTPSQITFRGPFVFIFLYRMVIRWLILNGFQDPLDKSDKNLTNVEKLYLERRGTSGDPDQREYIFWWRLVKPITTVGGGSKYFIYKLNLDWNAIHIKDIEVMHEDKKMKAQHGELSITISAEVEFPKLTSGGLFDFFNQTFVERGLRKNIEEHKKVLYKEMYVLQNLIKRYLETNSFLPREELFHEKFESQ